MVDHRTGAAVAAVLCLAVAVAALLLCYGAAPDSAGDGAENGPSRDGTIGLVDVYMEGGENKITGGSYPKFTSVWFPRDGLVTCKTDESKWYGKGSDTPIDGTIPEDYRWVFVLETKDGYVFSDSVSVNYKKDSSKYVQLGKPVLSENGRRCTCVYENYETYGPAEHAVTFLVRTDGRVSEAGGSAVADPQFAKRGESVHLTAAPNPGYVFDGWGKSPAVDADGRFTMPDEWTRVVANFKTASAGPQHTVTVWAQGYHGTVSATPREAAAGTEIRLAVEAHTGFEFDGWETVPDLAISDGKFTMPDEDVTVTAKFRASEQPAEKHRVTVNVDGGHGTVTASPDSATKNTLVRLIPAIEEGFGVFLVAEPGSVTISGNQFIMPDCDVTITAVILEEHRVTVNVDGGHGTAEATPVTAISGTEITLTQKADKGYVLEGWSAFPDVVRIEGGKFTMPDEDITVTAKFKEQVAPPTGTYRMVVVGAGGGLILLGEFPASSPVPEPEPVQDGRYRSDGWYTDRACTDPAVFGGTPTGHIRLYTKWREVETHKVTFDTQGHGSAASQWVPDGGKAAEPPPPTAPGWAFGGWYTDRACTLPMDFGRAVTADTTVYAKWTMNEGTRFTVSFDTQGHGSVPAQTVYEGGTASRPADPTAPGWAFGGWYTDRACTAGNKYDFGSAVVGNLTLYAKWAGTSTYEVVFVANGHGVALAQSVKAGREAEEPRRRPRRGGRSGWYTDEACTLPMDFEKPVTKNTALYARWTQVFKVTFVSTGHGVAPPAQSVKAGTGRRSRRRRPTMGGCSGWYTDSALTSRMDFGRAVTGNVTATPRDGGGRRDAHGVLRVRPRARRGDAEGRPGQSEGAAGADPPGGRSGWYTDRACTAGNKYDFGSAVVGNLTLYAKWAAASQGFAPEGDRDAMGLAIAAVVPALAAMAGAVFFRSARMPRNYP
ncbi:InlB B-repeat-containing protein [Methanomassiliicoccaceae archaeon COG_1]|nr:InlB B-repeat-containing protein [Methanomassiliicoccaceae archaeon COG_1]